MFAANAFGLVWTAMSVGSANAEIAELQQDLVDLRVVFETRTDQIDLSVGQTSDEMAKHKADIAEMESGATELQEEVANLEENLAAIDRNLGEIQQDVVGLIDDRIDFKLIQEEVQPSVVEIRTPDGQGSGFVVNFTPFCVANPEFQSVACDLERSLGYLGVIVTNNHVIEGLMSKPFADRTVTIVTADESTAVGRVWSGDAASDLAFIDFSPTDFATPIPFLETGPDPLVGDPVAAVGSPLGIGLTISTGRVTAVRD